CVTTDHLKILVEAKAREREVGSMCVTAPLSEFCRGNQIFYDPFQIGWSRPLRTVKTVQLAKTEVLTLLDHYGFPHINGQRGREARSANF
ncbi:MAG TPA: hypothetical protein VK567_07570, partial [Bradyrhizobium sp.]|nr:hypothetical protein [Bradyrhizobium sp.]